MSNCINSSKVYCKCIFNNNCWRKYIVLIVAKCIVNETVNKAQNEAFEVLIVAKCIVNSGFLLHLVKKMSVLIVAKCIVNDENAQLIVGIYEY